MRGNNNISMVKKYMLLFVMAAVLSSCTSSKKITYFQNITSLNERISSNYEATLKADDLLLIMVSSSNPDAAVPFNLPIVGVMNSTNTSSDVVGGQMQYQSYLVNALGEIEFPVIGSVKVGGLTRTKAMEELYAELKKYIKDPIINMRILNYKVSVMGEVVQPGVFNVLTERITLPEALSRAGDLTIYGNRKNILIVREVDGKKTHNFVDITSSDFINSPFYYLSQNDLVYVEPNRTKINSSAIGPNTGVIISAVSLLITIVALVIR